MNQPPGNWQIGERTPNHPDREPSVNLLVGGPDAARQRQKAIKRVPASRQSESHDPAQSDRTSTNA
ncbi:hypothetical protein PCANC_16063 [Puccinia coronata f. sp. avenae]|uniref:Uncharacterized protein n=1 Tax=Puccinia coronata f. sp. avenae TaxID=200324 RepID=A0A2N5T4Y9_9BASI|nr:hypothetical protein PCASD_15554 [Puccinia coronata f. sp. avenae]PLW34621.1 hypothetical protein PCANC_16063 [Puccinia coronata f. sp. avenae]